MAEEGRGSQWLNGDMLRFAVGSVWIPLVNLETVQFEGNLINELIIRFRNYQPMI